MRYLKTLFCCLIAISSLQAQDTLREVLPNGMTVIVREAHITPEVSIILAVRAGPIYEGELLGSGVSELLRQLKTRDIDPQTLQLMGLNGLRLSGTTERTYTTYRVETTQQRVEAAFNLLAQIAKPRAYTEEAFQRQQQLLKEEQQLQGLEKLIDQQLRSALYRQASQSVPISGLLTPLRTLQRQQVIDYDQSRYVSGNFTIIVNGNVAADSIAPLVRKTFNEIPQGFTADQLALEEDPMRASRSVLVEHQQAQSELRLLWRTVPANHADNLVIDLMADYLNEAQSPLQRALLDKQLADAVRVEHVKQLAVPGYLEIRIQLRQDETADVLTAVGTSLAALQDHMLKQSELDRLRLGKRRQYLSIEQDNVKKADDLLFWELATGAPQFSEKILTQMDHINPAHIQQAAIKYLRSSHSCKLQIKPRPLESVETQLIVPPQPITLVPPELQSLDNGVSVIARPLPIGLVHIVLSLGLDTVDDRLRGINQLLAKMIVLRTSTRGREDLERLLAQKGMKLTAESSANALQLQVTCFPEDTLFAIGLLVDCVTRANFQKSELEIYRQRMIAKLAIENGEEDWQEVLREQTIKMLMSDHYASQPYYGSIKSLKDIDTKSLHDQLARLLRGDNVTVSLYGSYDENKTAAFLKQHLSNARIFGKGDRLQPLGTPWVQQQSRSGSVAGNVDAMTIAWRAPAAEAPLIDKVAMDVVVAIVAGLHGQGGAMIDLIKREKHNPVIASFMSMEYYSKRGLWLWFLRVETDKGAVVREHIFATIRAVLKKLEGEPNEELQALIDAAKDICRTKMLLADKNQELSAKHHARVLLQQNDLQLVSNYLEVLKQVQLSDLKRVASRYLEEPASIIQMTPNQPADVEIAPKDSSVESAGKEAPTTGN